MTEILSEKDIFDVSVGSLASKESLVDSGMSLGDLSAEQKQVISESVDRIVALSERDKTLSGTLDALWQVDYRAGLFRFIQHGKDLASDMVALATVYDDLRSKLPEYNGCVTSTKATYDVDVADLFPAVITRFNTATAKFRRFQDGARMASEKTDLDDGATIVNGNHGIDVKDLHDLLEGKQSGCVHAQNGCNFSTLLTGSQSILLLRYSFLRARRDSPGADLRGPSESSSPRASPGSDTLLSVVSVCPFSMHVRISWVHA